MLMSMRQNPIENLWLFGSYVPEAGGKSWSKQVMVSRHCTHCQKFEMCSEGIEISAPHRLPGQSNTCSRTYLLRSAYVYTHNTFTTSQSVVGPTCQSVVGPTCQSVVGPTCQSVLRPTFQSVVGPTFQNVVGPTHTKHWVPEIRQKPVRMTQF